MTSTPTPSVQPARVAENDSSCADVQNVYRMIMQQADAGSTGADITSAMCSADGNDACACTLVFASQQTAMPLSEML